MKKINGEKSLSIKRETFCQEFLIDLNGRQAAIRAGYSQKTADSQASRLLSNVKVQGRLEVLNQKKFDDLEISSKKVLSEIARIAFSSSEKTSDGFEIKIADKQRALESLCKFKYHLDKKTIDHLSTDGSMSPTRRPIVHVDFSKLNEYNMQKLELVLAAGENGFVEIDLDLSGFTAEELDRLDKVADEAEAEHRKGK